MVHPYQRGSRDAAAAVRTESALAKADEEFQEDKFAKTSRGPRESRWKLWCSLAERSLPPLPITVELIDKVGALFKQARYRSAAQYYSVAISLNTDLRGTTGPQLSTMRSRKQSGRSPGVWGPLPRSLTSHWKRVLGVSSKTWRKHMLSSSFPSPPGSRHRRIPALWPLGVSSSWSCQFPRTTPQRRGATGHTHAYVCGDTTQAAAGPVTRLFCLLCCSSAAVRLGDIPSAFFMQRYGAQFAFVRKACGAPRHRSSETAVVRRVRRPRSRSCGWTSRTDRAKFCRDGHSMLFEWQVPNCSLERTWTCVSSCLLAAGAAQRSAGTSRKRQHWRTRQDNSLSFRPCSTKFGQWSRIVFEVRVSLYITFALSSHTSRARPSVRRLRATGSRSVEVREGKLST